MISLSMIVLGGICLLGLLVALVIGLVVVMGGNDRDVVSAAREGWIQNQGEQDEAGE